LPRSSSAPSFTVSLEWRTSSEFGRVGIKALIYFEVVTTLALIVGLVIVNILQPGAGMNVDAKAIDTKSIQIYTTKAGQQGTVEFFLNIIPATVVGAFAEGEILQVLFFAILFAFALSLLGNAASRCST
jgi:aerobic C4-dicarboxylate transport protein